MNTHVGDTAMGRIRTVGIIVAVALAAIAAWAGRHEMTHDGMAYLDMSQAVLRHDWARAVNGHWSPLYPWLLALGFFLVRPGSRWEFPTVHFINFSIFVVALVCFDFFLRQLLLYRKERATQHAGAGYLLVPEWAIVAVGYTLFIWSSLNLIGLAHVNPDLAVAAFVYLSVGWLLRSRLEFERWSPSVFLGLALGLGFLAKAPMLPLGFVFLVLTVFPLRRNTPAAHVLLRAGVTLMVFLVVVGTLVLAFFETKGRLMLGDSAWLNYAWHVNRIPMYHYQGDRPGFGTLVHPTRRLSTKPDAFEFATPIEATYPPWFDPAYWYQGLKPRFDLKGHLITARWSLRIYTAEGLLEHWWPSVALLLLVGAFLVRNGLVDRGDLGHYASLWVPAFIALVMYALIHLEPRYVAPFMPLMWLGAASGVRIPSGLDSRKVTLVVAVILLIHVVPMIISASQQAYSIGREIVVPGVSRRAEIHLQVADGLREMGVAPGDRVAVVGPGIRAYWAWLGRTRIVAEVPVWAVQGFWTADAQARAILDQFARAGVRVVVYQPDPPSESPTVSAGLQAMGWQRIGDTGYYAFLFSR